MMKNISDLELFKIKNDAKQDLADLRKKHMLKAFACGAAVAAGIMTPALFGLGYSVEAAAIGGIVTTTPFLFFIPKHKNKDKYEVPGLHKLFGGSSGFACGIAAASFSNLISHSQADVGFGINLMLATISMYQSVTLIKSANFNASQKQYGDRLLIAGLVKDKIAREKE